jgi:endo-1,3(4)-beta-glucanase
MGQNYGAGFYNDHHYHFGYHIYAAAVGTISLFS